MSVETNQFPPEDMYATSDEGVSLASAPPPPRRAPVITPTRVFAPVMLPPTAETMPDADLPLFTPKVPVGLVTANALIERCRQYLSNADVEKIREAYRYADSAHLGQFRKSGEPYITHPIAVASILASWKMDATTIQAGLMHDVLEDTGTTKFEMAEKFGIAVTELVDGVSKLDKLRFSSNEIAQAESFRKMLVAMARDVRVILVKLADRLHNLRTLGVMRPEKRARIAKETLDIYVPIAHRLGLNNIFRELQELSFANRYPLRYQILYDNVLLTRGNRRSALERILRETKEALPKSGIRARVLGRDKTIYGIYNKMREKHLSFSEALDIYGFRVVVRSREDCYKTLGALHQLYKPVPGRFKDFIAIPKMNGYQSLHTTVIGPDGTPVEYQIRTEEMHRVDEDGIITHWLYSDDIDSSDMQSRTAAWLQSLLEIQRTTRDSAEFLETIKVDLFPDRVYVFTPKGKIISLPQGATPVDFAYQIHTDVGNHAVSARINSEVHPLDSELKNGDMVEITTHPNAGPNPMWLDSVRSGRARAEIRQYLRNSKFEESVRLGRESLEKSAKALALDLTCVPDNIWTTMRRENNANSLASLYADIGLGKILPAALVRRIAAMMPSKETKELPAVVIDGSEGLAVQFAKCCHPIPGDNIIGFMRPGHGLAIHRIDCPHAQNGAKTDPKRWMKAQWGASSAQNQYFVPLDITVTDTNAALALVAAAIAEADSSIVGVTVDESNRAKPIIHLTVQVHDKNHLNHVQQTINRIRCVDHVQRSLYSGELPPGQKSAGKEAKTPSVEEVEVPT